MQSQLASYNLVTKDLVIVDVSIDRIQRIAVGFIVSIEVQPLHERTDHTPSLPIKDVITSSRDGAEFWRTNERTIIHVQSTS